MKEINYLFSIGFRCNTTQSLIKNNLRMISSPFDYLFIDLDTAFDNIKNKFENLLNNIVLINLEKKICNSLVDNKNISESIKNIKKIGYMSHDYNNKNIYINQNYINNITENLYDWNKICVFIHHNLIENNIKEKIEKRYNIFNKIYEKDSNNICLLYITKIIENNDIDNYIKYIKEVKKKYDIQTDLIIIICGCNVIELHFYDNENNILFIIKRVKKYKLQYNHGIGTDNNFDFIVEFNIIKKYYKLNLFHYKYIQENYGNS